MRKHQLWKLFFYYHYFPPPHQAVQSLPRHQEQKRQCIATWHGKHNTLTQSGLYTSQPATGHPWRPHCLEARQIPKRKSRIMRKWVTQQSGVVAAWEIIGVFCAESLAWINIHYYLLTKEKLLKDIMVAHLHVWCNFISHNHTLFFKYFWNISLKILHIILHEWS